MNRWKLTGLFMSALSSFVWAQTPGFQGVGNLDGSLSYSDCVAVSGDGSVVMGQSVGTAGGQAFRWTRDGGMEGIGNLEAPLGMSHDGSVVYGSGKTGTFYAGDYVHKARQWTRGGGIQPLSDVTDSYTSTLTRAASNDGSVIVGYTQSWDDQTNACIWKNGQMSLLNVPGFSDSLSRAMDISPDGSTVLVGISQPSANSYLWTEENGYQVLGADNVTMFADNGRVLLCEFRQPGSIESYLWTAENGYTALGLPEGWSAQYSTYLAEDGSVVLGYLQRYAAGSGLEQAATIWTESEGLRFLQDVFVNDYGLDLDGWTLNTVTGMSDDGTTFVGGGINPDGQYEGWIATVPEPASLLLLTAGSLLLKRRRRN